MCQNIQVKTVVDEFVSKGFMFTAFDVTNLLRSNGSQVFHSEVNKAVQEMFRHGEMTDYEKDIVDVGAPVSPFVYYHRNSDVSNYQSDWIDNNPDQNGMLNDSTKDNGISQPTPSSYGVNPTPITPTPNVTVKTTKASIPKGAYNVDKDGRLNIPPTLVNSLGVEPWDFVGVMTDSKKLVIATETLANSISSGYYKKYMVNKDGRIRINCSILKTISGHSYSFYNIIPVKGNIEIIPAAILV